jgi:hypothetical protein
MAGAPPVPDRPKQLQRLALAGFTGLLIGVIPLVVILYQSRSTAGDLRQRLHIVELENQLARSAVLARHGDYAGARDAVSAFFSAANEELATANPSAGRAEALRALLQDRDDVITLLARGDPAGADRVSTMYLAYRNAPVR